LIRLLLAVCFLFSYTTSLGFTALSIIIGSIGLWPTFIGSILVWAFVLYTALLFLEATFTLPEGANTASISKKYLGPVGSFISSIAFIVVHYSYPLYWTKNDLMKISR